jgi:dienelactone hydrolase
MRRFCSTLAIVLAVAGPLATLAHAQTAAERAQRIVDLMVREQFDDVAKDFNPKMAALLSAAQLRDVWSQVRQQAGAYLSTIDERVAAPPGGTTVTLGCRFEKTVVNIIVALDAENRIAGLRIVPRPPDQPRDAPTSTKFKEEEVTIGTGEWTLPGTLSMPAGPVAGAVVLVHGSGPHDRDETIGPNKPFRDLAWGLADRGVAVLRYDKRTLRYPGKRAPGATGYTVREETIEDALAAAAFLRARERINPTRIFVLGHSLGGTVAPRIADEDRALAGLVILAGTTRPLLDVAREQIAYLASLAPGTIDPEKALEGLKRAAPESYWRDLDAHAPADLARKLTVPMLVLQGERDYQVTMADLQGWKTALGGERRVTIKSYPTLNHLFQPGEAKSTPAEYQRAGRIPDFVFDDIAAWITSVK